MRWSLAAAMFAVGCGGGLTTVDGVVLLDGEPLAGATVMTASEGGEPATARTDDTGRFELVTEGRGAGATPGVHKVGVFAYESNGGVINPEASPKLVTPRRYYSPATSPLSIEVGPSPIHNHLIELSSGQP